MIDKGGKLYIIDFDRYDFGDPWEEFNRIVLCAHNCRCVLEAKTARGLKKSVEWVKTVE